MSDLIKREDAIEAIDTMICDNKWVCECAINSLPTVDAVEVIRCKDCKHRDEKCGMGEHRWCEILEMSTAPNDFCSCGECKEESEVEE